MNARILVTGLRSWDDAGRADCVRRAQAAGIPVLFFDYDRPADEGVWL